MSAVVKVYKKGIIVLPKSIREKAGIREGMMLVARVKDREIILSPLDLWWRVWGCCKGKGSAEDVERELDKEEKIWEEKRIGK
ncbi:MAG: AbrB family transcriptional regulator [Thermoprotei archaeon]|nr:MAG: AbrB family transcriptional regulator [Thermoprotei archaeon]